MMEDEPARILLDHGLSALVDHADLLRLAPFRWRAECRNGRWFAIHRERGSDGSGARWRTILLHRMLLDAPPGTLVVHVNGNSLDNRRSNLRVATRREVGMQRRPNRKNASGYKGVTRERRTGRWRAVLTVAGEKVPLGYYATAEEAARVYDAKAVELYGELARLNFPVSAGVGTAGARGGALESGHADASADTRSVCRCGTRGEGNDSEEACRDEDATSTPRAT